MLGDRDALLRGFSALQRAEIAEIASSSPRMITPSCFSALQRAEIAEIASAASTFAAFGDSFSALQRAEIAEIRLLDDRGCACEQMFQCSSTSRNC